MINPSIHRLILGKRENEAIDILKRFKRPFRIIARDGVFINPTNDRNDQRYTLIIKDGLVASVAAG